MAEQVSVRLVVARREEDTHPTRGELLHVAQRVCKRLNGTQTWFKFSVSDLDAFKDTEPAGRRGYNDTQYWTALSPLRQMWHCDQIIAISGYLLDESSFNREERSLGVGVVTVREYETFLPRGVGLEDYVSYLLLCAAICIAIPSLQEHAAPRGCLFDLCIERAELEAGLEAPKICDQDLEALRLAGVEAEQIKQVQRVLADIGHRKVEELITGSYGATVVSFFSGILVAVSAALLSVESPRWALVLLWGVLATVLLRWVPRRLRRTEYGVTHRRGIWKICVAVYLLVVAAGVFLIGVHRWPKLPSDTTPPAHRHVVRR